MFVEKKQAVAVLLKPGWMKYFSKLFLVLWKNFKSKYNDCKCMQEPHSINVLHYELKLLITILGPHPPLHVSRGDGGGRLQ